jgi:hypothetical protein
VTLDELHPLREMRSVLRRPLGGASNVLGERKQGRLPLQYVCTVCDGVCMPSDLTRALPYTGVRVCAQSHP